MKKLVARLCSVLLVALSVLPFGACTPRENVLKVFNWGDYMDQSIFSDFEEWYLKKTDKKITVKYSTFSNNETMYAIYKNAKRTKPDYDLVCPSEYMIETMIADDLLMELNHDNIPNLDNVYSHLRTSRLRESVDSNGNVTYANFDKYAVPYMWGTFGIMYNINMVSLEEVQSWSALFNPTNNPHAGKISMKDSVRDALASASMYANRDKLMAAFGTEEHEALVESIINDTSATALAAAEKVLMDQKNLVFSYESDFGKEDMVSGKFALGLMWSGDAAWAFYEDIELEGNNSVNVAYYVPHEGSNKWTDGFVIPKYAKNVSAAEAFLSFLCDPEFAYANMDESGYTSAVEEACDNYKDDLLNDEELWSNPKFTSRGNVGEQTFLEWYQDMYIETMFPSDEVLARCGVMNYFGDKNNDVNKMWNRIRA